MATFTGMPGEKSPDRLDSLVWSVTPYLDDSFGPVPQDSRDVYPWQDDHGTTDGVFRWATDTPDGEDFTDLDYPTDPDEELMAWPA